ncbi:hypothetical protein NDU88_006524 [Pleurodeles waltl]|uniref:Uncharacterized protein n=1 Tax=Pleurodeles waltl TaxID=8319 RepID=A0AAV7QM70_PLEWA|nr:hypothetical protein NDU88_006524 [Pleurodeles waltl]
MADLIVEIKGSREIMLTNINSDNQSGPIMSRFQKNIRVTEVEGQVADMQLEVYSLKKTVLELQDLTACLDDRVEDAEGSVKKNNLRLGFVEDAILQQFRGALQFESRNILILLDYTQRVQEVRRDYLANRKCLRDCGIL